MYDQRSEDAGRSDFPVLISAHRYIQYSDHA